MLVENVKILPQSDEKWSCLQYYRLDATGKCEAMKSTWKNDVKKQQMS